jgi:hypothetical protein
MAFIRTGDWLASNRKDNTLALAMCERRELEKPYLHTNYLCLLQLGSCSEFLSEILVSIRTTAGDAGHR